MIFAKGYALRTSGPGLGYRNQMMATPHAGPRLLYLRLHPQLRIINLLTFRIWPGSLRKETPRVRPWRLARTLSRTEIENGQESGVRCLLLTFYDRPLPHFSDLVLDILSIVLWMLLFSRLLYLVFVSVYRTYRSCALRYTTGGHRTGRAETWLFVDHSAQASDRGKESCRETPGPAAS